MKKCTPVCPHLRSFRYGFDGSRLFANYNGADRLAGCAKRPAITLYLSTKPLCAVELDEQP